MSFNGSEHMQPSVTKFGGFYPAEVIDDQASPADSGKVKVRVFPMMNGIDVACLPWAIPAFPLFEAANGDMGFYCAPPVGSRVWVFFSAGDFESPVYFASAPGATDGPAGRAPGKMIIKTRDGHTITMESSVVKIEHNNGNKVEITDDILLEHADGNKVWINDTEDAILLLHSAGQMVVLGNNGTEDVVQLGTSTFLKLVNGLFKAFFNAHIHTDPVSGVTTPPTVLMDDTMLTTNTEAS